MATKKASPTWSDVKGGLSNFDRAALLALVQGLYAGSKDNRDFLHARLDLGSDVLGPYKSTIARWISPDAYKNQDTSVSKAKKAIADYKKAIGRPDALAELMVYYCEQASGFCNEFGMEDEGYFDALVGMFEQALKTSSSLPEIERQALWERLAAVGHTCHNFGYGVGDEVDDLQEKYGTND
jgi:hypothetical protein